MYPTVTVKGFSGLIVVFLVVSEVKSFIFQDDGGTDFCARGVDSLEASCNAVPKIELAANQQKAPLIEGRRFQNERFREVRLTRRNAERFRSNLRRIRSDEAERLIRRDRSSEQIDNRAKRSFNRHTMRSGERIRFDETERSVQERRTTEVSARKDYSIRRIYSSSRSGYREKIPQSLRKRSDETERIISRDGSGKHIDNRAKRSFNQHTIRSGERVRSDETERIIRRDGGSGRLDKRAIRSFNRYTMRSGEGVRSDETERIIRRDEGSGRLGNRAIRSSNRDTMRSGERVRSDETERIIRSDEGSERLDKRAIRSFNRETMRSDKRRDDRASARVSDKRVRRVYVLAERSDRSRAGRDIRGGRSFGSQGEMPQGNFAESINGNILLSMQRKKNSDTRNERIPTASSVRISSGYIRQGKRFSRGTESQRENIIDTRSENSSPSQKHTKNHGRISNRRLSNAGREILGNTARNQESTRRFLDYDKNIGKIQSAVVNIRNSLTSESESRVSSMALRKNLNAKNLQRSVQEPRTTDVSTREGYSIRRIYSSSRTGFMEKIPESSRQERLRNVKSTPEERRTRDSSRSEGNRRSSDRLREFGNDRRQRQNFDLRKREINSEYRHRVDSTSSKPTIIARRSRSISSRRDVEQRRTTRSAYTWKEGMEESQRNKPGGIRISTSSSKSRETLMRDLRTISQESLNLRRMNIFSERGTKNDEARHGLNLINYRSNGAFEVRRYTGRNSDSSTSDSLRNLKSLMRISREPLSQRLWRGAKQQTEEKLRFVARTTRRNNRNLRKTDNFQEIRSLRMQQSVDENLRRSDSRKAPLRNHKVVSSRDLFTVDAYTTSVPDIQMKRRIASDIFVSIPSEESPGYKAFGNWQSPFQLTLASILVGQLLFSGDNAKRRCLLGNWMRKVQIF